MVKKKYYYLKTKNDNQLTKKIINWFKYIIVEHKK